MSIKTQVQRILKIREEFLMNLRAKDSKDQWKKIIKMYVKKSMKNALKIHPQGTLRIHEKFLKNPC